MNRLNVDRMRRYMARTTPDIARTTIDPTDDNAEAASREWLDRWGRRMAVKHPGSPADLRSWQQEPPLGPFIVEARIRTDHPDSRDEWKP